MNFDWKALLKLLLSVVIPTVYTMIKTKYPDFPIGEERFSFFIVWIVGALIGGWELHKAKVKQLLTAKGLKYEELVEK